MNVKLQNGYELPIIGYGTFGLTSDDVGNALKCGYRRIDSAYGYGNEDQVGIAVKNCGLKREEIFITTKVTTGALRENKVVEEFELSLANLQTDYVDLYLIHWPVKEKYIPAWAELEKIYASGKAKAIGFSNAQIYHLEELNKVWKVPPMVNQVEIHPYMTQKPLTNYCKEMHIAMEAWSPLAAGMAELFAEEVLINISKKYNKTISQIILRWDIQQGIMTIPKSETIEWMENNIDIFDFELTNDEMMLIDGLNRNHRTGPDPDNFSF